MQILFEIEPVLIAGMITVKKFVEKKIVENLKFTLLNIFWFMVYFCWLFILQVFLNAKLASVSTILRPFGTAMCCVLFMILFVCFCLVSSLSLLLLLWFNAIK